MSNIYLHLISNIVSPTENHHFSDVNLIPSSNTLMPAFWVTLPCTLTVGHEATSNDLRFSVI